MHSHKIMERIRSIRLREFSDLAGWRNYYFDLILFLSLIIMPIVLAVNLPTYFAERRYEVVACDLGMIVFIILNLFIRKPFYRGFLFFLFLFSIVLVFFISLGPFYARPGWLVLGVVAAALLFGIPGALAVTGYNTALLTILYFFAGPHLNSWAPVYLEPESTWFIFIVNISLISLIASLPASMLLTRLNISFKQELDLRKKLSQEHEFLQSTNTAFQKEIMEHGQTEEALLDSQQRLAEIIDFLPDPMFAIDLEGKIIAWNNAIEEMTGIDARSMLGKGDYEYAIPFYGVRKPILIDLVFKSDEEIKRDYHLVKKEGDIILVETEVPVQGGPQRILSGKVRPLYDSKGAIVGAIESIRDITVARRAEEALQESEMRFRALAEHSVDTIMRFDRQHRHLYVNPKVQSETGIRPEEFIGKTHRELGFPEDLCVLWEDSIEKVFESGQVKHVDFMLPAGIWIDWLLAPETDPQGRVVGVITAARDITERKHAEEALIESERRYRQLIEQAADGIFVVDPQGNYILVNSKYCTMLGYTQDELLTLHILDTYPEEIKGLGKQRLALGQAGETLRYERPMRRKDGSVFQVEISLSQIDDGRIQGIIHDITERKKSEAERKKLEDRLVQAQKMESIGTLAGGIAHDFNNILSSVLGFAGLAELKLERGQTNIEDELKGVLDAGIRARDLVRQILAFSRQTGIQKNPLDVSPLIKETLKFLRASLPTTIEIRQDFTDAACMVLADPTQLHQIVMNLCANASHAMKEKGGVLQVQLKRVELTDENRFDFKELQKGPYVQLSVSDTGSGIPDEIIGRIFDPFFTTKERGEGTGMGLSVVHGIVMDMGGDIFVQSHPGMGTRFDVFVPVHEGDMRSSSSSQSIARKGTGLILFVDDETGVLASGYGILKQLGYDVVTTSSALEAVEIFTANHEAFDLILTDMTMPGMTGIQVSKRIHEIRPDIPIVLCTGYSEAIGEDAIRDFGIQQMVMKPMIAGELAEAVFKALNPDGR